MKREVGRWVVLSVCRFVFFVCKFVFFFEVWDMGFGICVCVCWVVGKERRN